MEKEREKGIEVREERRGASKPAKEQKQVGRLAGRQASKQTNQA